VQEKKPTGISFVVANEHEIVQDLKSAGTQMLAEL